MPWTEEGEFIFDEKMLPRNWPLRQPVRKERGVGQGGLKSESNRVTLVPGEVDLVVALGARWSKSHVKRLLQDGAIDINDVTIEDRRVLLKPGDVVRVGKHCVFLVNGLT